MPRPRLHFNYISKFAQNFYDYFGNRAEESTLICVQAFIKGLETSVEDLVGPEIAYRHPEERFDEIEEGSPL